MSLAVRAPLGALVIALALGSTACTSSNNESRSSSADESLSAPRSTSTGSPSKEPSLAVGARINIDDPRLVVSFPDGWHRDSLRTATSQLRTYAQGAPPFYRRVLMDVLRRLKRGIIVGQVTGPVDAVNYRPTLYVSVETGDGSLMAAAARRLRYIQASSIPGVPRTIVSRRATNLPVGRAVRIISHTPPPPGTNGVPSQSVEYVWLIDGSTLSIAGTAPMADHHFVATMDDIAHAVRRS